MHNDYLIEINFPIGYCDLAVQLLYEVGCSEVRYEYIDAIVPNYGVFIVKILNTKYDEIKENLKKISHIFKIDSFQEILENNDRLLQPKKEVRYIPDIHLEYNDKDKTYQGCILEEQYINILDVVTIIKKNIEMRFRIIDVTNDRFGLKNLKLKPFPTFNQIIQHQEKPSKKKLDTGINTPVHIQYTLQAYKDADVNMGYVYNL